MRRNIHNIIQIIAYYIAWFACLSLANSNHPYRAALLPFAIGILQMIYYKQCHAGNQSIFKLITILVLLGFIADSGLMHMGLIQFKANAFAPYSSPLWMSALWFDFAIILYITTRQFFHHKWLLSLMSFMGFSLSYYGGIKLGAASFPLGNLSCIIVGLIWAILLPISLYGFSKWDKTCLN